MLMIGLAAAVVSTAVAVLIPWMPIAATREAGRIDFTFWFATVISYAVFCLVTAALIYAFLKSRVDGHHSSEDGAPIPGNTRLEVIWTTVPFLLVLAIAVVSAIVLSKDGNAG